LHLANCIFGRAQPERTPTSVRLRSPHFNSLRLRRRLPCHELPPLRSVSPHVEEFEPQTTWLAVDLGLNRRPARDERRIAEHAHLTVGKARALILGLARSHRFEPACLGVGNGRRVGVEKLIVRKRLYGFPIPSNHRRKTLVFKRENFLFAAHFHNSLGDASVARIERKRNPGNLRSTALEVSCSI